MDEFLSQLSCNRSVIDEIAFCIIATRMPAMPTSLKQEVLCDADTYHLGTNEFLILMHLLNLKSNSAKV